MNKKKILYIIRHGDVVNPDNTVYGREFDVPLSPEGYTQITQLAGAIASLGEIPAYIYSSPLTRTKQTTATLQDVWGDIPVEYRSELLETDTERFAGRPLTWARNLQDAYRNPKKDYVIEDPAAIAERMVLVAHEALSRGDFQVCAIVSHGDPIAFAVDSLLYPGKPLRSIADLREDTYLQRGQAWRLVCSDTQIIARSIVSGLRQPVQHT